MSIVPSGTFNINQLNVPGVVVQIQPPTPFITGVSTNIIGVVGIAEFGPVDSPVYGSYQQLVQIFGVPTDQKHDLMTQVYTAYLQGAQFFVGVRVTDGTDTLASTKLYDNTTSGGPNPSVLLQSLYSGIIGNTLQAIVSEGTQNNSFKITVGQPSYTPEVFDNIIGSGALLWQNIINAINNGTADRGPSRLVTASNISTKLGYIQVVSGGNGFNNSSTASFSTGSAAATVVVGYGVASFTIGTAGTGYSSAPNVSITGGGGTGATAIAQISGGAVSAIVLTNAGSGYTTAPTVTLSGGAGSGAAVTSTLASTGSILSLTITNNGNYSTAPTVTVSGGTGAQLKCILGEPNLPNKQTYSNFTGGNNGNFNITDAMLIGQNATNPPTGMYALGTTNAFYMILSDVTTPSYWSVQALFGLKNGMITVISGAAGQTIDDAENAIDSAAIPNNTSYIAKVLVGDYCRINDPITGATRLVSPQGFYAGMKAQLSPAECSLNKPIFGIISTQKTEQNLLYSDSEILQMIESGLDVISLNPNLNPNQFICLTGQNANPNRQIYYDNYTSMICFVALTLEVSFQDYNGKLMNPTNIDQAANSINFFLQQLANQQLIGDVTNSNAQPYSVSLVPDAPDYVLIANVSVVIYPVIVNFLINLQMGTTSIAVTSITTL